MKNACNQVKYRHIVYQKWGYEQKLSYGKGLSILFTGPPGTGKTMASQVIANELYLEIYKVDLSQMVSKYIGETEKNLKELFDEAKKSNTILLFDEADALFGKRSEVKDSHDRYANVETSFLLQKMEEHTGITIMTTNYLENIDPAFMRRINYVIHFPFPSENYRKEIWMSIFPEKTPLKNNIDFDFLSNKFELSGGNIKNIAVSSAFLAAHKKEPIGMNHILYSIKHELRKQGKILLKEDFGEYDYFLD
ncbi:ATP-binding protein [Crassaminicella profunda]|nr:ATP-binding protein [Crassaminicella profunda]